MYEIALLRSTNNVGQIFLIMLSWKYNGVFGVHILTCIAQKCIGCNKGIDVSFRQVTVWEFDKHGLEILLSLTFASWFEVGCYQLLNRIGLIEKVFIIDRYYGILWYQRRLCLNLNTGFKVYFLVFIHLCLYIHLCRQFRILQNNCNSIIAMNFW